MAKRGIQQQQAGAKRASTEAGAPDGSASPSSKRPKESTSETRRSPRTKSPSTTSLPGKSPKKSKTAPTTSLAALAAVESFEETTPPTSIESAPTTAASVTEVNESSSGKIAEPDADGSDEEAGKDLGKGSSDKSDSELDMVPTPIKKPLGIDRVKRGRKIKASSPAGVMSPILTCFKLFVVFVSCIVV